MNNVRLGLSSSSPGAADYETRVELARRSRAARRHRAQFVGPAIARDVPWDILMVLYTAGIGARLKVTSIQVDVGAPQTTVIRWLQVLEEAGYLVRDASSTDRRVAFVGLSAEGRETLDAYFDSAASIGSAAI